MFERENPDPQTDIEFDFFDESPTVEGGERGGEGAPPRRRRKMPTRPPGGSNPSLLRLGLLIAGAILLAAVLVLTVNNCRGNQKKAKYQDYMESVGGPAAESAQVGKDLNDLLTTAGHQARRSQVAARRAPPAAGADRDQRERARRTGPASGAAAEPRRGDAVPRQRPQRPVRRVRRRPGDAEHCGVRRDASPSRPSG